MEPEAMRYLAQGMMVMQMAASAIGEAWLITKAFEGMARNPEIGGALFTRMLIGAAVVESTAIYAFVAFFTI